MNFQQVRHTIDYVVQRVRTGRLALPDFQRDFVWNPSQVVELLDSVSKQWPIGSLLLLSGPQPFAFRPIDNGPEIGGSDLDLYILDGQQRVTALYHAVMDVSSYCYYVDFNALLNDGQEVINWERRDRFQERYPSVAARAAAGIALIKDVWEHSAFFAWLNEIHPESVRENYILQREERLAGLQSKVYQITAIELERGIELGALARIFETINRTGVALNAFDLLVAKLYHKFNLRDEWTSATESHDVLARFSPDELEVLKLISLLVRKEHGKRFSRGVRQGDLLALDSDLIIQTWHRSVDLYTRALLECRRFGVTSRDLVPSWSMVLGVAGCLNEPKRVDIASWWKDRLLRQTFAQAANTKIVSEFDLSMEIGAHRSIAEDETDPMQLLNKPARANGLFTRGLLALIAANGGRDPVSSKPLSEIDHIALRYIEPTGEIKKLAAESPIRSVIAMAESSSKKLKKGANARDLPDLAALHTQGIDPHNFCRNADFTRQLFKQGY